MPRMRRRIVRLNGKVVSYGVVEAPEAAPTVVLIHGWGLAQASYARAAEELNRAGYRVVVPDLPGFGRSTDLPFAKVSFEGYAAVLGAFLASLGARETPVHVVGHSFGGGVAAQLAHDYAELVASVVLVSAVSGATWMRDSESSLERLLTERPLWDWAVHLVHEFPLGEFPRTARSVLADLRHNLTFHLPSLSLVASLIRRTDLRSMLGRVAEAGVPAAVVWAAEDHVIGRAVFEDQCSALRCTGTVVEGNHGWPLADPRGFGRVIGELIDRVRSADGVAAATA